MLRADLLQHLYQKDIAFQCANEEASSSLLDNITLDSRSVGPQSLFIALQGTHTNGEDFIPEAAQKGVRFILTSLSALHFYAPKFPEVFFIGTDNVRALTSIVSKIFYPEQPETVVAVTGTNGKTSTVDFTRHLWECMGMSSASLGTLGVRSVIKTVEKHLTTPEAPYLHKLLQDLAHHHITHVAMEASSHGIDQYRLENVSFKAAAFTNLSPEHLDYHHTLENYLETKAQLFKRILPASGVCVLNADIPEFEILKKACGSRKILSFGYKGEDIRILKVFSHAHDQEVFLSINGEPLEITFPLIGSFQLSNALCALGLVMACHPLNLSKAIKGLETVQPVPGRLEYIASTPHGAAIYIDYAHTPDGIKSLLSSLRPHTKNHLHIVFGGGGNRDPSTRRPRGVLAHQLADFVYICDDNPRFEDPLSIRSQILAGCPKAKEIPDRAAAIRYAIQSLEPGDILVVAGKGREEGQSIEGEVFPFDDAATILKSIGELS